MIPQVLRPKYTIEQYLVVFHFPDFLSTEPEVQAVTVSGEDPNSSSIVGLPYVDGNLVWVPILGGIAGCVYEISCAAVCAGELLRYAGRLAVFPTAAEPPVNNTPPPFTLAVTTPPYVLEYFDGYKASATPLRAAIEGSALVAGTYKGDVVVADIEVRLMHILHTVDMGQYTSDCSVVSAEVRTMRITETQAMGGYEPDAAVVAMIIEQIRVVLTDTQENLYEADATVTDIEVVVP